jgi:hypothetical protein
MSCVSLFCFAVQLVARAAWNVAGFAVDLEFTTCETGKTSRIVTDWCILAREAVIGPPPCDVPAVSVVLL